jgi:biopolymer transport protein ExbD
MALLFTFMANTPPITHGVGVDRAHALHSTPMPGVLKEDAMRILIARDGSIYFGNHRIIAEELPREIQERVQNGAEEKIYLAVDPRTRYGSAEKALDQIRIAGIRDVSFLTDQPLPPR